MSRTAGFSFALLSLLIPVSTAFASGGVLFLSPSSSTHAVGQSFAVKVYVDTGGVGVSAAEARLSFDPTALSVTRLSTEGSVLGSWPTQPSFSNASGIIQFSGWASSNYYTGSKGLLLTITFTALRNTTTTIRFDSGTILSAGNASSNIISSMRAAAVAVQPQEVIPVPPPAPAPVKVVIPSPPPPPPTLAVQGTVSIGSDIVAKGAAAPNAIVYVWLQKQGNPPIPSTLAAGPNGSFAYVSDAPASEGTYTLWAQAQGKDGQKSALSQVVTVTAAVQGFAAAAALTANVADGFIPYLILLGALALCAWYLYRRYGAGDRTPLE